jgi:RHS repeat-associated protein
LSYGAQTAGTANNLLLVSQTVAAGSGSPSSTTSMTHDAQGNIATMTDALGHVTRYRYDADRELLGVVGPDPDGPGGKWNPAQRITYDADGRVTLRETGTASSQADSDWGSFSSHRQVATAYDANGRRTQDSAQAGGTTYAVVQYSYDADGRLDCTAQRMNPAVFGSLPDACTLSTQGSYGPDRISRNEYDAADQVTKVWNGYRSSIAAQTVRLTYTPNGKLQTLMDANGNLTTYIYDGMDRLYQTRYPSPTSVGTSNASDYEQLGYDLNSNVTSRRLRDGNTVGFGYDALNRLTSRTSPHLTSGSDPSSSYGYDLLGHLTSASDENSHALSFSYDALGNMTGSTSSFGSSTSQYDAAGRRTRLTWPDGFYVTYDYDNAGEMTAIHENGGTVLASFTYDDLGNRRTRTLANGTSTTYSYDAVSRLTSLALAGGTSTNTATLSNYSPAGDIGSRLGSNDAFAWSQAANVNRGYTVNGLNQFGTVAGAAQGYDARGNMTSSGGASYSYNSRNQLVQSGGSSYLYDALGRLDTNGPEALHLVYDGTDLITEATASGNAVARRYVFGPGTEEPIVWYEGSGTGDKRYLDQDERGSVTRITKQDGSTLALDSYDEYGIPASANQGRFQYTGQAWLPAIGMAYYKARIYSPTLGRFMQTDPIGYGDGPNWYNYVGENPINRADTMGTWGCTVRSAFDGVMEVDCDPVIGEPIDQKDRATSGFSPGGNSSGGSSASSPASPQKPADPCAVVAAQQGKIAYTGVATSIIFGGGITRTSGQFTNLRTGSTGKFVSYGVGLGASAGAGVTSGTYDSISNFVGYSETAEAGVTLLGAIGVSGFVTTNANNQVTASGGGWSFGVPLPLPELISRLSASATASDTSISSCTVGTRQ